MAGWGSGGFWGACSPWGLGDCESEICEFIQTRILAQMDPTVGNRDFRDFMCIVSEPFGKFVDVAKDVAGAFDIDTAVGVQLDMIGSAIDLPRSGFDVDEDYRTLLKIQATILMGQVDGNWTGSVNQVLGMVRTFIDHFAPTASPITYALAAPYGFTLAIPSVLTGSQFGVLFGLLCKALYAGVLGFVEITPTGNDLWASAHGPAANSAIWCSAHGPTATPCGLWSGLITTGSC